MPSSMAPAACTSRLRTSGRTTTTRQGFAASLLRERE
jgi:hypothetical protein